MPGRNVFLVNVADVRRAAGSRKAVAVAAPIGELRVVDTVVSADADVAVEVELESVDDGIVATGSVRAPWTSICRRCLGPAAGVMEVDVREVFSPNPIDDDIYALPHDQVDLAELARDAIALELPLAPLCRPDCEGLGSITEDDLIDDLVDDLDDDEPAIPVDPRWAALESIKQQLDD